MEEKDFNDAVERLNKEKEKALSSISDKGYLAAMKPQYDKLIEMLTEKLTESEELVAATLQPHKCLERCMKYCYEQAMKLRQPTPDETRMAREGIPIVTPVSGEKLLSWICDYLKKDDKQEIEEEEKKKKAEASRQAAKKEEKPGDPVKKPEVKKKAAPEKKAAKKSSENENQISFFDLLGVQA